MEAGTIHLGSWGIAIAVLSAGCQSVPNDRAYWLVHSVRVPKEHRYGRGVVWAPSEMERYIDAYERNWWACLEDRAMDIHHVVTWEDTVGNGWPSAIDGYRDGYLDADRRVRSLIERHADQAVQAFLLEATGLSEYAPDERWKHRYRD